MRINTNSGQKLGSGTRLSDLNPEIANERLNNFIVT